MFLSMKRASATWAALPLELMAGVIFFCHGIQKMGNSESLMHDASAAGMPQSFGPTIAGFELAGGLLLLAGFLVRPAALSHLFIIVVYLVQIRSNQAMREGLGGNFAIAAGFEFPLNLLLLFAAALALIVLGGDPLSIDDNVGIVIQRSRTAAARREVLDSASLFVKAAGLALILGGILIPFARHDLGLHEGRFTLGLTIVAGTLSALAGAALVAGKHWAYLPVFALVRLYLASSALLLAYSGYSARGLSVMLGSLAVLGAMRSARRGMTESNRVY